MINKKKKNKIIIINGFNTLGRILIKSLQTENNNDLIIIEKNINKKNIDYIKSNNNIKLIEHYSYIQTPLNNSQDANIIYISIFHNELNSEIVTDLQNLKDMLENALETHSYFLLVTPLDFTIPKDKIDFFFSVKKLLSEYANKGLKSLIINIGQLIGPEMDINENNDISKLIKNSLNTNVIKIEKNKFINYIYTKDALEGIQSAINKKLNGEYTISNYYKVSLVSIALRIGEILGKQVNYDSNELKEDSIKNTLNIIPNWTPHTSLENILDNTYLWIKDKNIINKSSSIRINKISPIENEKKPIRNYIPQNIITTPIVPQKDLEIRNNIKTNKINLGSFKDLKNSLNDQNNYNNKIQTFEKRSTIPKTVFTYITLIILYIIFINPFVTIFFRYIFTYEILSNFTLYKSQDLYNNVDDLENNINDISWIFSLTKKGNFYDKVINNLESTKSFAIEQRSFFLNQSTIANFNYKFSRQDPTMKSYLNDMETQNNSENLQLFNTISTSNLNNIQYLFPWKISNLYEISNYESSQIQSILSKNLVYADLLLGDKTYILLVLNSNKFSTDSIANVYSIKISNGILKSTSELSKPNSFNSVNSKSFLNTLENYYNLSNKGIIVVDSSINNDMQFENNDALKNYLVKNINNTDNSFKTNLINSLKNNSISIYLNNTSLSQSDIIKSLE